ncbi:hypothetical protein C1752_01508 [Acaryochloris thomasi RCC1774]|uniref:DUF4351 domain-containing protein n=1 Tax=Acaryochloris thomasi RCC1774 TaxID=1764569 RepID=A0A2W1JKX2_9CYAN|nr:hypothetical protein C1752_01508 [Acaryochloris thomasi RCC1774]
MKQSVIYQDIEGVGREKGRQEEGQSLVLRQLAHRFGKLPSVVHQRIKSLSLQQTEDLSIALLDITDLSALETWLQERL